MVLPRLTGPERRESIIEKAIELFSQYGFRGTTTRELAAACGVSEPTLYQHFPSKSDLYAAIIDSVAGSGISFEQIDEQLRPFLIRRDDAGYFRTLLSMMLDFYEQNPNFIRLRHFSSLEGHDLSHMFFERMSREFCGLFISYLTLRKDEGGFRSLDPNAVASLMIGAVDHYGLHFLVFHHPLKQAPEREEFLNEVVRTVIEGVRA